MSKSSKIEIEYQLFDNENELSSLDNELLQKAKEIAQSAYAPYSNFLVGAAIRTTSGKIITGNNQENAAFPSGLCAERTAIYYLGSQFPNDSIEAIAVAARRREGNFLGVAPCGGCRQAMIEYETKQKSPIKFIMKVGNENKVAVLSSISSLLPFSFTEL